MLNRHSALIPCISLFMLGLVGGRPAIALQFAPNVAAGVVFHDRDGDGQRDDGEPGIAGVGVSNGREVVETDADGRYSLTLEKNAIVFVLKPRGWRTAVDANHMPQFYYIHRPEGSPPLRFGGIDATGPLPASIDFALTPQEEPDKFEVVYFGDTQPRTQEEVDFLAHDIVAEVIGTKAAFGVTLGDCVYDDLSLFAPLAAVEGRIGVPWYHVLGNHDQNYDAPSDDLANETYRRHFGPEDYAFDYGPVHFVVLDNVVWRPRTEEKDGYYRGGFTEKQLTFLRNDLARTAPEQLVVMMMHIPLRDVRDKRPYFEIIEKRPNVLTVAGHWHNHVHEFFGRDAGWQGEKPHYNFVSVTACGSWWRGARDEVGLPHATMQDGAPNGYSVLTFDKDQYVVRYKAARRPADYQMNIWAPTAVDAEFAAEIDVLVNVFNGSERSKVEMRFGDDGEWRTLERIEIEDPYFVAMKEREKAGVPAGQQPLPKLLKSPHIWRGRMPERPARGTYVITVRTEDMFGQKHAGHRLVRIE